MSVIGGQNPIVQDGLVYILDFANQRTYLNATFSGSFIQVDSPIENLIYSKTSSTLKTGSDVFGPPVPSPLPELVGNFLEFRGVEGTTSGSYILADINPDGLYLPNANATVCFVASAKNTNSYLLALENGGTSTRQGISFGSNNVAYGARSQADVSRGFSGDFSEVNHVTFRLVSSSVECFVNGLPVSASNKTQASPNSNSGMRIGAESRSSQTAGFISGSLGTFYIYDRPLSADEIYDNYLQQARRYGLPEPPKPYTIDENAYLYLQTAGITGSTEETAINNFVVGLKSSSLWDKMIAIYPFLGGDTTKTRYNLKEPTLAFYDIEYTGDWSASPSGAFNNNTASYGILDEVRPSLNHPLISSESIHLSYLSYDTPTSGGYLMGVEETPGLPGDIAAPAAAYSVRKVRTAYTGSAMNVRRDFDDVTFDVGFDGSGNLDTGSLLTNMTASGLTETLPGDYSGLAAAYSLRKVSSSYSGYAVEVRRDSDNYSASIGFDSFGNLDTASLDRFIVTGSGVLAGSYSGLAAAYSLRQVVPGYSGFAIQIESASLTQDISFNSDGTLDTASIATFAGSGDAFVKIWYDQSGNNNHATQSNASLQPKVYSGSQGSVILENGRPALDFPNSKKLALLNQLYSGQSAFSYYFTTRCNTPSSTNSNILFSLSNVSQGDGNLFRINVESAGIVIRVGGSNTWSYAEGPTDYSLFSFDSLDGTNLNTISAFQNSTQMNRGGSSTTLNIDPGVTEIGSWNSGYYDGVIQEVILYTSSQATNRTYIENNINSYYGIYTPDSVSTDSAYVKTWYDQSGNNNHATQSVTSSQPLIVDNGVIVTENGKPAVQFDGTDDQLDMAGLHSQSYLDQYFVTSTSDTRYLYPNNDTGIGASGNDFGYVAQEGSGGSPYSANYGSPSLYANGALFTGTTRDDVYSFLNGNKVVVHQSSSTATWPKYSFGNYTGWNYNGKLQELIAFTSSVSASRGLIEDNINGYYNIFTHSLDSGSGYVTTWYDQSGNDNHASQSVAASQPLILSSGSIVTGSINIPALYSNGSNWLTFSRTTTSGFTTDTTIAVSSFEQEDVADRILVSNNFNASNQVQIKTGGVSANRVGYTAEVNGSQKAAAGVIMVQNEISLLFGVFENNSSKFYLDGVLGTDSTKGTSNVTGGTLFGQSPNNQLWIGRHSEILLYTSSQSSNRQPIESNINTYFNIYTPPAYNLNTNSLSLFSSPTLLVGAANNVASASFTTGGPAGLITVTRTGSSDYTLWKNRVPTKTTLPASVPLSNEIYLNAANLDNALFSASQNTAAYVSVGAGLTDDEVYTYYELVDDLQTSLDRGPVDPDAFITVWDTTQDGSADDTIILPLYGTQAITASWGDGTESYISSSAQADRTHSYAESGTYTVTMTGEGQGFDFDGEGDKEKLMDIVQWGFWPIISGNTFEGCTNLVLSAADAPSSINNLSSALRGIPNFNAYLNNWDVSSVTSLFRTFFNDYKFNSPLDRWDVSNVTSFRTTFTNCQSFNQPIGNWDVSKADSFCGNNGGFLQGATSFDQDLGSWNVTNVVGTGNNAGFQSMFSGADRFNNGGSPSINNWRFNTSSDIGMVSMFNGADSFNQNIGDWNVEKVVGMNGMFSSATSFNNGGSPDINNWRPISCSNFSSMFNRASSFNQPIENWPLSASNINLSNMFYKNRTFNQPLGGWDTKNVVNMAGLFSAQNAGDNVPFNQNIGSWDVSGVTGTSNNQGFYRMFKFNSAFNNSGSSDINNWRFTTSSDVTMKEMFNNATSFNQNIGAWNVEKVTNMSSMFNSATSFNQNLGAWDTSNVTNMASMFAGNNMLFNNGGSPDINNWNTSNVTDMNNMFWRSDFDQPVDNWDVSNVTDMRRMFFQTPFDQNIGSWNVEKVTTFYWMFDGVFNNSGSSDINNWSPVSCSTFDRMFFTCGQFNQPVEGWTLPADRTYTMVEMFDDASSFNQSLGDWNIVSASDMTGILDGTAIDIPNYTKTLRGWGDFANSTGVQTAVPLGASGKKYGAAHAQRKVLTDTYGWTITDGGQEPFVFTINTTASGYTPGTELTFTLPILDANTGSYALDILVDWGDSSESSISSSNQAEIQHTYSNSGSYEITITGSLTGFRFNNGGDKAKVTDVSKWSAFESNQNAAFYGCSNLVGTATDAPFISTNTLYRYFRGCTNFDGAIGNWDVSNITSLESVFQQADAFDQNIGSWDVSNVTNMFSTFASAQAFNQDIGSWDVEKVTNMTDMFNNADAFDQNIGSWDVSSVTTMSQMFKNNGGFNNSGSADINNWRPISCSIFSSMFEGATVFNQPIGNWPLSASNINMSRMFWNADAFNQNIGSWDVSRVTNMSYMFYLNNGFNNDGSSDINNWDVSSVTTFLEMFSGGTIFNQPIGNWQINTSSAVSMDRMFDGNAGTPQFNQPIGSWDTSRVTNMNNMFRSNTVFNQDIGTWNVGNVTNFGTNFMSGKTAANYSYLHTIYDGWINNKLQPNLTLNFGTANYSASAAEGKALMTRTYNTASIIGSNDDLGQIAITCSANHNVVAGNKIFISGSSYAGINGVQIVHATGSATTLTIAGVPYDPLATDGEVITGYGWTITDGNPV